MTKRACHRFSSFRPDICFVWSSSWNHFRSDRPFVSSSSWLSKERLKAKRKWLKRKLRREKLKISTLKSEFSGYDFHITLAALKKLESESENNVRCRSSMQNLLRISMFGILKPEKQRQLFNNSYLEYKQQLEELKQIFDMDGNRVHAKTNKDEMHGAFKRLFVAVRREMNTLKLNNFTLSNPGNYVFDHHFAEVGVPMLKYLTMQFRVHGPFKDASAERHSSSLSSEMHHDVAMQFKDYLIYLVETSGCNCFAIWCVFCEVVADRAYPLLSRRRLFSGLLLLYEWIYHSSYYTFEVVKKCVKKAITTHCSALRNDTIEGLGPQFSSFTAPDQM